MTKVDVLDHGYVELVESWGSDESVIAAARQSTQKDFRGWGTPEKPGDEKLLRFLWENGHSTPFEFLGATFEVQAPIFVFREWHRHRVPFGYSEASARYAPLPDVNYVPSVVRLMTGAAPTANRQAAAVAGSTPMSDEVAAWFRDSLSAVYVRAEGLYQEALARGVPKELARAVLPVGRYSRMRATGNLRGWLGFLKLRMAENAQYEIRMYAHAVHSLLAEKFPRTLSLFDEKR